MPNLDSTRKLTKSILSQLNSGYELSAGILFPNVGKKMKGLDKFQGATRSRIRQAVKRLEKSKMVKVAQKGEKLVIEITKEGTKKFGQLGFEKLTIDSKKWDGKWRLVLFSIPESQKKLRESLRNALKNLGFYQLQRGVFVTPYPCDQEVTTLTKSLNVESYTTSITAVSIDKAEILKKHFNL
jgi:phenylacetic acid degradation operon negative regulatory protein